MASFGGFPQTVNYQTVNVSAGGGSENLLINPRGKINQANESGGVLAAGAYFCDGWKAGSAGAEIYVDADGFRLISGSIVQLVPNNLEAGRTIRGNMDVVSGLPTISINGGTDNELSDTAEYIQFEVSGDNSKFTRMILAESTSFPLYQQQIDELSPCLKFLFVGQEEEEAYTAWVPSRTNFVSYFFPALMHSKPSVTVTGLYSGSYVSEVTKTKILIVNPSHYAGFKGKVTADARP